MASDPNKKYSEAQIKAMKDEILAKVDVHQVRAMIEFKKAIEKIQQSSLSPRKKQEAMRSLNQKAPLGYPEWNPNQIIDYHFGTEKGSAIAKIVKDRIHSELDEQAPPSMRGMYTNHDLAVKCFPLFSLSIEELSALLKGHAVATETNKDQQNVAMSPLSNKNESQATEKSDVEKEQLPEDNQSSMRHS